MFGRISYPKDRELSSILQNHFCNIFCYHNNNNKELYREYL